MLTPFTLRARNKTMLTVSGDPSQQGRTRKKMSQCEGKADTYRGMSQADAWEPL